MEIPDKKVENPEVLNINSTLYNTRLSPKFKNRKPYKPSSQKLIISFIPGTILDILVKKNQDVRKGDVLLILDAMKMQNRLRSNIDGSIKKILVNKGDKVPKGTILMELK
jgi:pyruvate carboxylase